MCMSKAPSVQPPAPQAPPPTAPLAPLSPSDTPAAGRAAVTARKRLRIDLAAPSAPSGLSIPQ